MPKLHCILLFMVLATGCGKEKDDPVFSSALEEQVLEQVNLHRSQMGLAPLSLHPSLSRLARNHSGNMALQKVPFGHDGFSSRADWISKNLGSGSIGENVAMSSDDAVYTVQSLWLTSPGHKANIEGQFTSTGIGVAKGTDGYWYYTQIFYQPQ